MSERNVSAAAQEIQPEILTGARAVAISGHTLPITEYRGQRVVTLAMVDEVHQRAEGTARKRFNDHKDRFIEGEDFFVRNSDEARRMGFIAPNGLILLTETGYLMLVKSFTDDLAWQVQRQLVAGYFRAAKRRAGRTEVFSTFRGYKGLAKLCGLDENQAALAANRATVRATGVAPLEEMGITHLVATQQEPALTATDIGARLGSLTARAVNEMLTERGLHTPHRDGKGNLYYEPTDKGRPHAVFMDTGKKHSDGTPVRQLRWAASVISALTEVH